MWDEFQLKLLRSRSCHLFVPKSDFLIEGIEEEIGVKAGDEIYVGGKSEIYEYIRKVIDQFRESGKEEDLLLLDIFLATVFDPRMLATTFDGKETPQYVFRRFLMEDNSIISEDLLAKLWNEVDMENFTRTVLAKNYSLFSIENWSRGILYV